MANKRVYISGPMRGYELWNFPAFDTAQEMLESVGWDVISPAEMDRLAGFDETVETEFSQEQWREAMRRDYEALLNCDAIALLPGWENSEGAQLERDFALRLGLEIFYIDIDARMVHPSVIIGLCGYAQSGKDTLAAYLTENWWFDRRAFADPIRDVLYNLNPLILADFPSTSEYLRPMRLRTFVDQCGWDNAKQTHEVRSLLQRLGSEAGRDVMGGDIWVDTLFKAPYGPRLVITDVRFPNEAEEIKRRGGIIIRVVRDGYGPVNEHVSEVAYEGQDILIENNGSIEDLVSNFIEAYEGYFDEQE
jgi:hypothetical protein